MSSELKLAFAGDLLLGGEWPKRAQSNGVDLLAPFMGVSSVIENADIFFVNLEGPISGTGFHQRGSRAAKLSNHPHVTALLKRASNCVCVLANNHIMDEGENGLELTRRTLEKEGVLSVGAGSTSAEAERPVIVECKGKRIGCLAFSTSGSEVGALTVKSGRAGCADLDAIENVEAAIKRLKTNCDVVVVSLHWGVEFFEYPKAEQVLIVDRLVKAGADYIMGHHPHVLQGIEKRGRSIVMYSLGHFFVPPFRRADGELIRPKTEAREFAIISSNVDQRSFEIVGGRMTNELILDTYDAPRQSVLRKKLEAHAPGRIPDYESFITDYCSTRPKELRRERKLEAFRGLIREPITEIKRRIGGRASARTTVTA
jgi:hypothetical protein